VNAALTVQRFVGCREATKPAIGAFGELTVEQAAELA